MTAELLAANIGAHWLQSCVLAAASLLMLRLFHLPAPRARLVALQLTLAAIVLLPALQPRVAQEATPQTSTTIATFVTTGPAAAPPVAAPQPWTPPVDPARAVLFVMLIGIATRLLRLAYGAVRLSRICRRSTFLTRPEAAADLERALGVSARYIAQTGNRGPWTSGFIRPTVALPSGFEALTPEFQRAVICHELLHIKRRDISVALVEELAVAVLWFHPSVWLLRARIRVAREQVVDARVVEVLGNREQYVRCLVDISGHDLAPHFSQAGVGMLRPRELRARIDAIFDEARMSGRRLAAATVALIATAGATTYVAAAKVPMRAAAIVQSQAPNGTATTVTLDPAITDPIAVNFSNARLLDVLAFLGRATGVVMSGYNFDEGQIVSIRETAPFEQLLDRLLTPIGLTYTVTGPRQVVISRSRVAAMEELQRAVSLLENARRPVKPVYAEYPQDALEKGIAGTVVVDITVNAAGDVTTAAVVSGPQELRASAFNAALSLKYTPGTSTTAMRINVRYTRTGNSWGVSIADVSAGTATPQGGAEASGTTTPAGPDATGAFRIGGAIMAPKKVSDVPPVYPAEAQAAKVQGVVIMEARVDESGNVSDVRLLRSIPLLDAAAVEAVKQWKYTPTLLNGVAVPVLMTVTVNFSLRDGPPGTFFRLAVGIPDGYQTSPPATRQAFTVRANDVGVVQLRDNMMFGFVPLTVEGTERAQVSVYRMNPEGSPTPQLLGSVEVASGGVVSSPTNPSFRIELLGVEQRRRIEVQ